MTQQLQTTTRFNEATNEGETKDKSSYHQMHNCNCTPTTRSGKGAYRDVTVEMPDGRTIHFYHQHPVVIEEADGTIRISSCGYHTVTTKERINRRLPTGYKVVQRDFEWFLETPDGRRMFRDGMKVDP